MRKSAIFMLDTIEGYNMAERFKFELECGGYKVTTSPYTTCGVRIEGVKE